MPLDISRARVCLQGFDFKKLFVEEMGWDHHTQNLPITVEGETYPLSAVAEKRGLVVFICKLGESQKIPNYNTRRKIEKQVARSVHEHILIFTDSSQKSQIWQWVKREPGKPIACREHSYHCNQPGDSLLQKCQTIAFSFEEEENLTLPGVTGRARAAFDVDRVTKKFYAPFKTEHDAFFKFLEGIPDEEFQRWYVSVMLNRLMFIYFIQKKGFLDNDLHYLRNKLAESRKSGKDRFYSHFLCPLFFEGFAKTEGERSPEANRLLGKVPYLNGAFSSATRSRSFTAGISKLRISLLKKFLPFLINTTGIWMNGRFEPTMKSIRMFSAIFSKSMSTRSRWDPATPKKT